MFEANIIAKQLVENKSLRDEIKKLKGMHTSKNGLEVEYGKIPSILIADMDGIIYYMSTSTNNVVDHANAIKEVISMLQSDSYDHGSEWRMTKQKIIQAAEWVTISLVSFRVKDSY